ncbi:hypothetical protein [Alcaligenes faecalis]|uniref:hypothetical protein n=1 Tax=Alcaligenes faecalis TaxID=511 RepID=UPI0021503024|nr:hypothetical protein [Alcaligenes faecalis]MCR4142692.1 hypothetical protein [Alcaligenes faecalis]
MSLHPSDLFLLRQGLVDAGMKQEAAENSVKHDIAMLRTELKHDIAMFRIKLTHDIEVRRREMITLVCFILLLVACASLIGIVIKAHFGAPLWQVLLRLAA